MVVLTQKVISLWGNYSISCFTHSCLYYAISEYEWFTEKKEKRKVKDRMKERKNERKEESKRETLTLTFMCLLFYQSIV